MVEVQESDVSARLSLIFVTTLPSAPAPAEQRQERAGARDERKVTVTPRIVTAEGLLLAVDKSCERELESVPQKRK